MSSSSTTLSSTSTPYDFDKANPGITIEVYANDHSQDCVIAARAHHTIRLAYVPGLPPLSIYADEITEEYTKEARAGGGIDFKTSLMQWQNPGWRAGGISGREIAEFADFSVNGAGLASGDPSTDWSQDQVMNSILEYTGLQAQIRLPQRIRVDDNSTYGPDNPWTDTTQPRFWPHVMLLTGYDINGILTGHGVSGPIGITWGKKQTMSWEFLKKYCLGVIRVTKGPTT